MPRTHSAALALPLVPLLAALAACGGPPRAVAAPAPVALPADSAPAPEVLGDSFAIAEVKPAVVSRDLLGTATYDLPVQANRWVEMELGFLVNQRRDVVGRWMERSEQYSAFVQDVFAHYGIPRDLHHLAMVESGYQPTARSHAGAVGMWQFMAGTGRGMGLRIDDVVDERMDPVRSTHAAARHLRQLWQDFGGDWALAAAAYNAGGGRISRGLRSYGSTTFWDLAERGNLAQETRHYVPRLYAVTIIARDPARFGYPAPSGLVRRFAYDSVQVDLDTPLPELAKLGGFSLGELVALNPHLYRGVAPENYWVWVPAGAGAQTQQAYRASDFRRRGGLAYYTLRRGEDLSSIALASNLTPDQVRSLNLSLNVDRLGRGDRVRLYADAVRALQARPTERVASADDDGEKLEPRAERRSRTASEDAEKSESRAERRSRTASGDEERPAGRERSRAAREGGERGSAERTGKASRDEERSGTRERSRGSSADGERRPSGGDDGESARTRRLAEARRERESERGDERPARRDDGRQSSRTSSSERVARHTVQEGETLWSIARANDITVARLREANDLGEGATLQPGQKLRIPAATAAARAVGGEQRAAQAQAPRTRGSDASASSTSSRSRTRTAEHVVKNGETLWSIARQYDITVAAIRDANGMSADSLLQPGQKLRIPRGGDTGR